MMGRNLAIWNLRVDAWAGVALPMVKRVFAGITAKEFVAVQPMTQPSGLVFYLDYKYGIVIIVWDEELWWEEDDKGVWQCPQTAKDDNITDSDWKEAVERRLIIPAWEVERDYGRYEDIKVKKKVWIAADDFVNTSQIASMTPPDKSVYNSSVRYE